MITTVVMHMEQEWSLDIQFSQKRSKTEIFDFLARLSRECTDHVKYPGYAVYIGPTKFHEDCKSISTSLVFYNDEQNAIRDYLFMAYGVSNYVFKEKPHWMTTFIPIVAFPLVLFLLIYYVL